MKTILLTSSALLLASGLSAAQAQDAECPAEIDAFTRDYEEAMAAFGSGEALSSSEQADLFGLRTTAETALRAGKPELCMDAIARARLMLETAIAPTAVQPRELVGMEVRNAADEYLGEVDDITLDPVSGRIAYVLVEHGGFLGIGDSLYPVPWRAVTWVPGAESLLLDVNEEQLENAPRYVEDETTAQQRRAWLLSVHSYYGVEPYWQAGIGTMVGAAGTQGGETEVVMTPSDEASGSEPGVAAMDETQAAETGGDASDEQTSVVVVEPDPAGTGTSAGARSSDASASGSASGEAASADGGSTAVAAMPVQDGAASDGDGGALDAVMARMDELESRIEELSEQGAGEDVAQAIDNLETRVQELAESAPGQQVQAAIEDLDQRVQELAQSAPGEEIRSAVSELQTQVQELAQSDPARELRETVARMESEIRQLAAGATGPSAVGSFGDGAGGTRAASTGGSGKSASAGEAAMSGEPRVIVIKPEDVQVIEPGAKASDAAAADGQGSGQETAAAGGRTDPTGSDETPSSSGQVTGQKAEAAGAPNAQGGTGEGDSAALAATQAMPAAESDLPNPEAGNEAQAALAGQGGGVEPCETGITRLEEELARAEEMGLTIDEARSELESAQAMLSRDSEALCRAAVKRAQDDLVAQGFEPAQEN